MIYIDIKINYSQFDLAGASSQKGIIAVLMYTGSGDPKKALDNAVLDLTSNTPYVELIDAQLDNPWMRAIMIGINKMKQADSSEIEMLKKRINELK